LRNGLAGRKRIAPKRAAAEGLASFAAGSIVATSGDVARRFAAWGARRARAIPAAPSGASIMLGSIEASTGSLVPAKTPFTYNVGINYESWIVGRTGYSITADLNQIFKNFGLIRTYHDAAVGTANPNIPQIDPTQLSVIKWVVQHPGAELVMGTNNNALAQGGFGSPWSAGLMASKAYTDLWVQMLVKSFGGVQNVKVGLKTILLGNELDQNGPPPTDPSFDNYVNKWIPAAFDNLKASLAKAGLGSIPVTTSIANYGPSNTVSVKVPNYISSHWSNAWNNGEPFVMFNQYTQNGGQSTNFGQVEQYFESVDKALGNKLEVFIGETGYSTYWGAANQTSVYKQMFAWLNDQRAEGGKTVPLFVFDAFDRPAATPPQEVQFGIYNENANSQPTGLKNNLKTVIPGWTNKHISLATSDSESLYSSKAGESVSALAGHDIVLGRGGDDTLLGQAGSDLLIGHAGHDLLRGGSGKDGLDGSQGNDTLDGGPGSDTLDGGVGADAFVLARDLGADRVVGFEDGVDQFGLEGGLRFRDLSFAQAGEDAEIRADGRVLAVLEKTDATLLSSDDFFLL
jgi:Ca2+-binding RTX toxin-like protein